MSRDDDHDDDRSRYRTREEEIRARNLRDPYEADRQVRTYRGEQAADHPWRAAHTERDNQSHRAPAWNEQPARYGGGYRDDEPRQGHAPDDRGDGRYGQDTGAGRHFVQGYQNEDSRHRAHGYGPSYDTWRSEPRHGQSNSGYDAERAYGQGNQHDDARSDRMRASWTQEHDYQGPRYGAGDPRRSPGRHGVGSQYAHTDTYGGAGFRQEGKRYWFDEGDQRGQFRGTQPRGYARSDERLRELACERLTDADLDATHIEVKVEQGTVTLEGSVSARWMKHAAEDVVDDLGGVKDIQNHLRVRRGGDDSAQPAPATGGPGSPGNAAGSAASASPAATASGSSSSGLTGQGNGDVGGRSRH